MKADFRPSCRNLRLDLLVAGITRDAGSDALERGGEADLPLLFGDSPRGIAGVGHVASLSPGQVFA